MQGRNRTARPEAEKLEPGTYQLVLDRAFITVGMPKPEYCKKDASGRVKTPEESAYAQITLVWKDSETDTEVKDSFLKLPEFLEMSEEGRYKSKFQKRLEQLINKQLDDNGGEHLAMNFDFIESWEELMDAIKEEEQGRPAAVTVKEMLWDGHQMFGREWLVNVGINDKGYNQVNSVAPLPKRRPQAAAAAPAPVAQAAPTQQARPAPKAAAAAVQEHPVSPNETVDLPF